MQAPMKPQINLTELIAGKMEFPNHYTVQNNPNFAPDIVINLQSLITAVETNGGVANMDQILIKLIHRYNGTNWFLTLVVCEMDLVTGKIIGEGARFDLNNGAITPSSFTANYDPAYFNHVLCNGQPITPNLYVNSINFPWYQQIMEMKCQNNLPAGPDVYAKFSACTYDYSAYPQASLVPFPHIVLIYYYATNHGDYVDDAHYTQQFTNRAADMGGLCPPCCNQYYWPASLPGTPTCLGLSSHGGHGGGHGGHGGGHGNGGHGNDGHGEGPGHNHGGNK